MTIQYDGERQARAATGARRPWTRPAVSRLAGSAATNGPLVGGADGNFTAS